MKFLFLTNPAYGNLNTVLGIITELVKKKHHVVVYNTEEFAEIIKKTGAECRLPPFSVGEFDTRKMNSALNIAEKILEITEIAVPPLTKIIQEEKFDCLFHDAMGLWGKLAAYRTKTPAVSLISSMAINKNVLLRYTKYLISDYLKEIIQPMRTLKILHSCNKIYKEMDNANDSIIDLFVNKEKLNLVFTSKYFQPISESFDPSFKFVGPIIFDRKEQAIPEKLLQTKKPKIYISLGTAFNDNIDLYKMLIKSISNSSYQIFLSIGNFIKPTDLGKIPDNIYISAYLPQLEILKEADLFISHGGMNSVNESLYFGVPMLLFPIIQEQRINASRVEELGAGIYYKQRIKGEEELITLTNKILSNNYYKKNALKIGQTLVKTGGLQTAVDHILAFVKG